MSVAVVRNALLWPSPFQVEFSFTARSSIQKVKKHQSMSQQITLNSTCEALTLPYFRIFNHTSTYEDGDVRCRVVGAMYSSNVRKGILQFLYLHETLEPSSGSSVFFC